MSCQCGGSGVVIKKVGSITSFVKCDCCKGGKPPVGVRKWR